MTYQAGQQVWLSPEGNLARTYRKSEKPMPATVTAVKRKYIYVRRDGQDRDMRFPIGSDFSAEEYDSMSFWQIWPSKEAYFQEKERLRKLDRIRQAFRDYRIEEKISADAVGLVYGILARDGLIEKEE